MDRDCTDKLKRKTLGAFYTPEAYALKAKELLDIAVSRVPDGNDYIIIDRCAGTGGLEKLLEPDLLSHFILSTLEASDYEVLKSLFSSRVRHILPPADALSLDFIKNPDIIQYLNSPYCTVILFENPPFTEATSLEHQKQGGAKEASSWKNSYVLQEMKKTVSGPGSNELCNAFIWSAFRYYLRQDTDSYIVFSPVKYWKSQHLINRKFISGFGFNRRHFGLRVDAFIMAALWSSEEGYEEKIRLKAYDLDGNGNLKAPVELEISRIYSLYSSVYYDKRPFADTSYDGILTRLNGYQDIPGIKRRIRPLYSKDMLGYLVADSVGFDNPDTKSSLLSAGRYNGNGFYLHKDNYLQKLPLFAASRYTCFNRRWTERGRIMKSADGAEKYFHDLESGKLQQWLLRCLLFCCLDVQNHMLSFYGSDGRYYRNELCLDVSNGETIASRELKLLNTDSAEQELLFRWQRLLSETRDCPEYNENLSYGVYQIYSEIDTSQRLKNGRLEYNNSEVHAELLKLKVLLKEYYLKEIVPLLFKYEFLK